MNKTERLLSSVCFEPNTHWSNASNVENIWNNVFFLEESNGTEIEKLDERDRRRRIHFNGCYGDCYLATILVQPCLRYDVYFICAHSHIAARQPFVKQATSTNTYVHSRFATYTPHTASTLLYFALLHSVSFVSFD